MTPARSGLRDDQRELIERALRLGVLYPWEAKAVRLALDGMPDNVIGPIIGRHVRHVRGALEKARDKMLKADLIRHRETIPLAANKIVTEPLRGAVPDEDHPDLDDPEHFKPIILPPGRGETIRPTLVTAEQMGGPLKRAFRAAGI